MSNDLEKLQHAYLDMCLSSSTVPDIQAIAKRAKVDISEYDETQLAQQLRVFDGFIKDLFGATLMSLKEDLMIMDTRDKIAFIKVIAEMQKPAVQQQININNILSEHWKDYESE